MRGPEGLLRRGFSAMFSDIAEDEYCHHGQHGADQELLGRQAREAIVVGLSEGEHHAEGQKAKARQQQQEPEKGSGYFSPNVLIVCRAQRYFDCLPMAEKTATAPQVRSPPMTSWINEIGSTP